MHLQLRNFLLFCSVLLSATLALSAEPTPAPSPNVPAASPPAAAMGSPSPAAMAATPAPARKPRLTPTEKPAPTVAPSSAPSAQDSATTGTASAGAVWVGKSDQAVTCEKDSGIPLFNMEKELTAARVKVLAKKKIYDAKIRIQMCGIDKGDQNGFQIHSKDLEKALKLGFQVVPAASIE